MSSCLICLEEKPYMTIGACGHPFTCLECTYKSRVISKNFRCVYCNESQSSVFVFNQNEEQPDVEDESEGTEFTCGIKYINNETRIECLKLENKNCMVKGCKAYFKTEFQLHQHLKINHQRYLCQICIDSRALLLREQKLYRYEELGRHLEFGDFDEENNLILLHPYCHFCKKHFYNDDQFFDHLRKAHFHCGVCSHADAKYTFYNKFENLKIHYEAAHFVCRHPDCQGSVFKTKFDLMQHINKDHNKSSGKGSSSNLLLTGIIDQEDREPDNQGFNFLQSVK